MYAASSSILNVETKILQIEKTLRGASGSFVVWTGWMRSATLLFAASFCSFAPHRNPSQQTT
jgi:hypothetical protein